MPIVTVTAGKIKVMTETSDQANTLKASFPEDVVRGPEVLDPKACTELPCRDPFQQHQLGPPKPSVGKEAAGKCGLDAILVT